MAQQVLVQLVDDVDGSEATQTVRFGLDGISYEIDVNDSHAEELRSAVDKFALAGRKTRGGSGKSVVHRHRQQNAPKRVDTPRPAPVVEDEEVLPPPRATQGPADNATIRSWAGSNGIAVPKRGRIPQKIRDMFDVANGH